MWERILVILRKEFRQALREPRMRVLLFVPPMVQLLIFGYAVNLDVDHVHIAWSDQDRTPQSRDLRARFEASGRFDVVAWAASENDVQRLLDRGEVQAVVRIQPNFAADLARGRASQVQVLIDGTNSNTASLVANYAGQIIAAYSAEQLAGQQNVRLLTRSPGAPANLSVPRVTAVSRVWFNPELKSRNYFIPGVVANIIMIVTLMLTSLAIVREKEIGTMEQLMVTPVRPIEIMLGKTIPFGVVGLLDVVLITTVALVVFQIPFRGHVLWLLASSVLFLMTTLGAGLFISTISQTQQQAMMSSFFFSTPAFMLSGFTFPIRNMPEVVQWVTYLNPMRYFVEIVRGIFLKGAGPSVLWPQMLALGVYGVTVILLSAARFHKKLD
jgi:ABC-2 type transport system permease protein